MSAEFEKATTTRRDVLARAGALGAIAVLGAAARPETARADSESSGFGAYFVSIVSSSASNPMFRGILALAAGGVAINVSAVPRGTHVGSWAIASDNTLHFRIIAFQFDSSGNNTGYVQVVASGPIPDTSIHSAYTVTFFPAGGGSQVVDQGTLSGNRLPS